MVSISLKLASVIQRLFIACRDDAVGPKSARIHDRGRRMAWADSATWLIFNSRICAQRGIGTIASPSTTKAGSPRFAYHGNVALGCLPCRLFATRQTKRSSRRCLRCRELCGCPQVGARALGDADSRRMHGNDAVRNACPLWRDAVARKLASP